MALVGTGQAVGIGPRGTEGELEEGPKQNGESKPAKHANIELKTYIFKTVPSSNTLEYAKHHDSEVETFQSPAPPGTPRISRQIQIPQQEQRKQAQSAHSDRVLQVHPQTQRPPRPQESQAQGNSQGGQHLVQGQQGLEEGDCLQRDRYGQNEGG